MRREFVVPMLIFSSSMLAIGVVMLVMSPSSERAVATTLALVSTLFALWNLRRQRVSPPG